MIVYVKRGMSHVKFLEMVFGIATVVGQIWQKAGWLLTKPQTKHKIVLIVKQAKVLFLYQLQGTDPFQKQLTSANAM